MLLEAGMSAARAGSDHAEGTRVGRNSPSRGMAALRRPRRVIVALALAPALAAAATVRIATRSLTPPPPDES
jgi:hypothetical protein